MNEERNFQLSREWDAITQTSLWKILNAHMKKLIESRQNTCEKVKIVDQEKVISVSRAQGELEMLREILAYPDRIIKGKIQA